MSTLIHFPNEELIREQAGTWIVRLDRGLSQPELQELRSWLQVNPRHRAAFLALAELWDRIDILNDLSEWLPREATSRFFGRNRWKLAGVATAATVLVCLGAIWLLQAPADRFAFSSRQRMQAQYRTAVGEHRVLMLPDRSVIDLNTNSVLAVRYTSSERTVDLVQGEAYFKVAKDSARVFTVRAGNNEFKAVGTAFNVRVNGAEAVDMTVTEGRVKVLVRTAANAAAGSAPPAKINGTEIMVDAGRAVDIDLATQKVEQLRPAQISAVTAWTRGMIAFDGEPLEQVVKELSRYSDARFVIAREELKQLPVAGYFKVGDIDGLLGALQSNFNIDAQHDGNVITLTTDQ